MVVVAGHGQLGLQQHRVDVGAVGVGQQLAQVLLVQPGVEEVAVGVAGRRLGRPHGDVGGAGRGDQRGLPVWLDGPAEEDRGQQSVMTGLAVLAVTHPFLSSSFLMREVMSNPRKGFWSGSLVGEEETNLFSLSTSCWWLPRWSPGLRSGVTGGLAEPPLLITSSENKIEHQTWADSSPSRVEISPR